MVRRGGPIRPIYQAVASFWLRLYCSRHLNGVRDLTYREKYKLDGNIQLGIDFVVSQLSLIASARLLQDKGPPVVSVFYPRPNAFNRRQSLVAGMRTLPLNLIIFGLEPLSQTDTALCVSYAKG